MMPLATIAWIVVLTALAASASTLFRR